MIEQYQVPATELSASFDPGFVFDTTDELSPLDEVIGQKRAVDAIDFGLNMDTPGYNIFVTGEEGTGKSTIVRHILTRHAAGRKTPDDICLVHNFDDPFNPAHLFLPPGTALRFKQQMALFIEQLQVKMPHMTDDEEFQKKIADIQKKYTESKKELFEELDAFAGNIHIKIASTENGYQAVAMDGDQPMSQEVFDALAPEKQESVTSGMAKVTEKLADVLKKVEVLDQEMQMRMTGMISEKVQDLVSIQARTLDDFAGKTQAVGTYLKRVRSDIVENMALFMGSLEAEPGVSQENRKLSDMAGSLLKRYQVNVLVTRRNQTGAPVVIESNPSFSSLFGKIEKPMVTGPSSSDFTMVQAGSLLEANNGYLVIEIASVLAHPESWEKLKVSLQSRVLQMEDTSENRMPGMYYLKPLPIDLDVKVILLGSYETFRAVQQLDHKFDKLFKVRADFDDEVQLSAETMQQYARFIAGACRTQALPPFSRAAVTKVIEYSCRLVADKSRLSLRFGHVMGMLKEAGYWAGRQGELTVSHIHVQKAVHEFRFRHNLYEEKVHRGFEDGTVLMDVTGMKIGQVNALAVYQMGNIAFGRPGRITAESYMGAPGIINVEHEADLSGGTHDKGVMIISGFLGRMFAQDYPISVTISITFEQNYSGVDGDSASSTELYAVLSSLSDMPVRQGIAVTGSVNQKGEIQAIGGVNEKIEGFYDVCVQKGLTGDQGVMIPASNIRNLMLRRDVIDSVEKGKFHIFGVRTVQEGIEVLTGTNAGKKDVAGRYAEGSVFRAVQEKLKKFFDQSRTIR